MYVFILYFVCIFIYIYKNTGLPYAPAPRTPMMRTQTITGAANLSSNRKSILTTMAITRPLQDREQQIMRAKLQASLQFYSSFNLYFLPVGGSVRCFPAEPLTEGSKAMKMQNPQRF